MKNGFTLIELIISIAILGLILGFSIPSLVNFNDSTIIDGATEELISVIRKAQEKAMMVENNSSWFIDFSRQDRYVLFSESNNEIASTREEYSLPSNIRLTTNNNLLKFERLNGRPNRPSEISLILNNKKYKIYINPEGTIDYFK